MSKGVIPEGYQRKWSTRQKMVFVINMKQEPLSAEEMVEAIIEIEPKLNFLSLINRVRTTCTQDAYKRKPVFSRRQIGGVWYYENLLSDTVKKEDSIL
jgi:hypothetical protein